MPIQVAAADHLPGGGRIERFVPFADEFAVQPPSKVEHGEGEDRDRQLREVLLAEARRGRRRGRRHAALSSGPRRRDTIQPSWGYVCRPGRTNRGAMRAALMSPTLRQRSDAPDQLGRRVTLRQLHPDNPASTRFDGVAADDGVLGPVGALDEHVGLKRGDDLGGVSSSKTTTASTHSSAARISARSASGVIGRSGPLFARTDRSELTPTISASPSRRASLEVANVTGMKQVEDAVGEDDRRPPRARTLATSASGSVVVTMAVRPQL